MQYNEHHQEEFMTSNSNTRSIPSVSEQHQDHYNNYNNNNYTHGTGRFLSPEQCESIKNAYCENISERVPGAVAHMIEKAFANGLEAEEIVMAIEETGFAPNPSPWYLKKILENWVENGVTVSKIRHEVSRNQGLPWWK